jgi:preprotein translocase subunit SecF
VVLPREPDTSEIMEKNLQKFGTGLIVAKNMKKVFLGILVTLVCLIGLYLAGTKMSRAISMALLIGIIVTIILFSN